MTRCLRKCLGLDFTMTRAAVFAPFDIIEGDRSLGVVLVADHALRELPEEYGSLGLPADQFDRHIAYDIGVEMVTRKLVALLGAPAIMARFSRLLIDPNRGEEDPTLIVRSMMVRHSGKPFDGAARAGAPLDRFYRPYHDAVGAMLASVAQGSVTPHLSSRFIPSRLHAGPSAPMACRHLLGHGPSRVQVADRDAVAATRAWSSATTSPMTARCGAIRCPATPVSAVFPMR